MKRYYLMRILAVALAAVLVLLCSSAAADYDCLVIPSTELMIRLIEEEYGIHVLVPDGQLEGVFEEENLVETIALSDDPDEALRQQVLLYLAVKDTYYSALPLFPQGFLESFDGNLYVCFVDSIYLEGYGLAVHGYTKYRNSVPEIYLIFDYDAYQPSFILHEGWHAFELKNCLVFDDWESLNPPGFVYTGDYSSTAAFDPEWFYRGYSTVSAAEDRATVFEAVYSESDEWWEEHPHIKQKLDAMMQAVEAVPDS